MFSRAIDAPDGFGSVPRRDVTTTATQALMMMNGRWTLDRAGTWARHLSDAKHKSTEQLISGAIRSAFGYQPDSKEIDTLATFLRQQTKRIKSNGGSTSSAEHQALTDLCHVLFNSNQFVYID